MGVVGWIAGGWNRGERGRLDQTHSGAQVFPVARATSVLGYHKALRSPPLHSESRAPPAAPPQPASRGAEPRALADPSLSFLPAIPHRGWVPARNPNRPALQSGQPAACARSPRRGLRGAEREGEPRGPHPDSRCTPSARALACPASIVRIRWRLVSSGFPPSLAVPLAPL